MLYLTGFFGLLKHFGCWCFPSGTSSHPAVEQWLLSGETSQKYQTAPEDAYAFSPNEGSASTDGISHKHVASHVKIKSSLSEAAVSHLLTK